MTELYVSRSRSSRCMSRLASRLLTSTVLFAATLVAGATARPVWAADLAVRYDDETASYGSVSIRDNHKLTIQNGAKVSAPLVVGSDLYVGWDGGRTLTLSDGCTVTVGSKGDNTGLYDGTVTIGVGSLGIGMLNFGGAASETAIAAVTLQAVSVGFGLSTGSINVYYGTTTLSGDGAGFIGTTDIEGGTLALTGTLGGTVIIALQNGPAKTLAVGAAERAAAAFAGTLTAASISFEEAGPECRNRSPHARLTAS